MLNYFVSYSWFDSDGRCEGFGNTFVCVKNKITNHKEIEEIESAIEKNHPGVEQIIILFFREI